MLKQIDSTHLATVSGGAACSKYQASADAAAADRT